MRRSLLLALAMVFGSAPTVLAADAQDRFQAHGLGRLTCKRVIELCETKKDDCQLVVPTWFEGYLTGFNALYTDTYDILPWQPAGLVADFTMKICAQNPDAAMLEVANAVIRDLLIPNRIKTQAERTRIGEGDNSIALYRETVRATQQRLVDLGFLKGGVDGAFGPGTRSAVEAFQKAAGLPTTGTPDVRTLIALFYSGPQQQGGAAQRPQSSAPAATPSKASGGAAAPAAGQPPAKLDLNLNPSLQ
ncbi:MAG: peptidoglycan-binding protein [Geminicoccaceae bacterium]